MYKLFNCPSFGQKVTWLQTSNISQNFTSARFKDWKIALRHRIASVVQNTIISSLATLNCDIYKLLAYKNWEQNWEQNSFTCHEWSLWHSAGLLLCQPTCLHKQKFIIKTFSVRSNFTCLARTIWLVDANDAILFWICFAVFNNSAMMANCILVYLILSVFLLRHVELKGKIYCYKICMKYSVSMRKLQSPFSNIVILMLYNQVFHLQRSCLM